MNLTVFTIILASLVSMLTWLMMYFNHMGIMAVYFIVLTKYLLQVDKEVYHGKDLYILNNKNNGYW